MPTEAAYYIDACVFIDFIELPASDPKSAALASILEDAEKGRFRVVTSVVTFAEVLWAKEEKDRQRIKPEIESKIELLFHPGSSPIELIPVHELIAREAQRLLRGKIEWSKTKGVDAIHLITAQREKVDEFFTTEEKMARWGPVLGFKVAEPHYDPPPPPEPEPRPMKNMSVQPPLFGTQDAS